MSRSTHMRSVHVCGEEWDERSNPARLRRPFTVRDVAVVGDTNSWYREHDTMSNQEHNR